VSRLVRAVDVPSPEEHEKTYKKRTVMFGDGTVFYPSSSFFPEIRICLCWSGYRNKLPQWRHD